MARQPRKLKKGIKKALIIYDVSARPNSLPFDEVWKIWEENGLLLYDSKQGNVPEFANRPGSRVKIIDTNKNYKYGEK